MFSDLIIINVSEEFKKNYLFFEIILNGIILSNEITCIAYDRT